MENKIMLSKEQLSQMLKDVEVPVYMHSPYLSKKDFRVYWEIDVEKLHFFQFGKLGYDPRTYPVVNDK